jgi:phosphoribosylaminoimidazole-succinocarboxamide synthase
LIARDLLYEGKAKKVFLTDRDDRYLIRYKDDATAFNGEKKGSIIGKGAINNTMSAYFFQLLQSEGVESHFVEQTSSTEMVVRRVEIIPLEVIVRNIAAGSMSARLGIAEGTQLARPVVEFSYKRDDLGDPLVNDDHILALGLADEEELAKLREMALRVNTILREYLSKAGITLVDFKLEFGRLDNGEILLADEISPDTCRFWDSETGEKMDKDRFRRDLGNIEEGYRKALKRVLGGGK